MKKLIIIISMLFSVAYGQTCDTVTNLTFSLVTTSTARVTWTHATNKITYNWALYCLSGCGGIAQQSGNTAGNTLNLSGLNSSFAYQFCITTYCGATSSTPKCSNFTTLSPQIQYTPMTAAGYQFKYVKVDTGFNIPFQDTSLKRGTTRPGALVCNTADSNVYSYNGNYWELLQGVNSAANKVDSVIINSAGDSLFYWINGTSYGQVFGGASSRWSILGNSGTVAGTNFIGTTDSVRLDLRTNNTIRQSITGSGNVGIGTVTPSVTLDVYGSARIKGDGLGETFVVDSVDNINLQARSGTDPNFTDFNIDQANGFYFRKSGIDVLGNLANGESFMKSSDGFGSILVYPDSFHVLTNSTRRLTINSAGNIGIGTSSPISKLHVSGTIRGTDSLILSGLGYGVGTQSLRRNGVTGAITWADTTAGGGGAAIDTANKWVNTITRTAGKDSIIFYVGTTRYAIKDSVGGGAGAWSTSGDNYTTGRLSVGTSSIYTGATLSIKGVDNDALNGLFFKPNNESISTQMGWGGISSGWVFNILGAGPVSLGTSGAYDATFLTSNAVRMTIASGGNVGINIAAPTSTLHANGSVSFKANVIADADYSVTNTDYMISCKNFTGDHTITLPSAASFAGRILVIVPADAGGGWKTLFSVNIYDAGQAGQSQITSAQGGVITIQSDGTNWQVITQTTTF